MGGLNRPGRGAITAVTLAFLVVGCGEDAGRDRAAPADETHRLDIAELPTISADRPPPSPQPSPVSAAPGFQADPATCDGVPHRTEVLFLDAGLGHRYLSLRLVNCSDRPLTLSGVPPLGLQTSDGTSDVTRMRRWEDRPPVMLAPGENAFMGLEYLAADQLPTVSALVVDVDGQQAVLRGDFDLDARTRITAYPWVPSARGVWPR